MAISSVNIQNNTFVADGQTYEITAAGIQNPFRYNEEELINLLENVNLDELNPVEDTFESTTASSVDTAGKSSEELEEMKAELEDKKAENYDKMGKIEDKIEELIDEATEKVEEAEGEYETAQEQYQEDAKATLKEQMKAYVAANKEDGEGMTREQLQQNIANALPNAPQVAEVFNAYAEATGLLDEVDSLVFDLRGIIEETKTIEDQISSLDNSIEMAKAAEEAAKSCDPIGFETEDGTKYDFIVDDGAFDSTSDFLGAEDQWAEMEALDTDGDGIVNNEELKAGNIKMVKTEADGTQSVVDVAEEFGEDFSIDLNSYKSAEEGAQYAGIDAGDHDGDGTANQELLGTFGVNLGDGEEAITGYNTLDDTEWLADEYGLSVAEAGEDSGSSYSAELQIHADLATTYEEQVQALRERIDQGYELFELEEEEMADFDDTLKAEADKNANEFLATLNANQAEEEDQAEETPEDEEELLEEEAEVA